MQLDPKTWWYVTRASGFVAWALLAIAVLWGLFITNKTLTKTAAPAWVLDLHRHLGGLAVVFVAIHVGALPLDTFTSWGWRDLFVPMASPWHPGAIAWGIVAMYLLVAIEVTSLLGRHFPKKWWRRVHILSFPLYVIASVHLFAAGTDSANVVARWLVVTVSTLIVFLAGVRGLATAKPRETTNSRVAAAKRAVASAKTPTDADAGPAPALAARDTASVPAGDLLPSTVSVPADDLRPSTVSVRPGDGCSQPTPAMPTLTIGERVERIRSATSTASTRARELDREPLPVGTAPAGSDPA